MATYQLLRSDRDPDTRVWARGPVIGEYTSHTAALVALRGFVKVWRRSPERHALDSAQMIGSKADMGYEFFEHHGYFWSLQIVEKRPENYMTRMLRENAERLRARQAELDRQALDRI